MKLSFHFLLLVFTPLLLSTVHAQAPKSAQVVLNAKAVQMQPSTPLSVTGVGVVTVYYSTYNGQTGSFLIDSRGNIVSGEVRPRAGSATLFEGAYLQTTPVATLDYGSFAVPFPTADVDGDGTLDVIQFEKGGSFSAAGSGYSTYSGLTFSISIQFSRVAGSVTGTYTATTINSAGGTSAVSGVYALTSYQGSIS